MDAQFQKIREQRTMVVETIMRWPWLAWLVMSATNAYDSAFIAAVLHVGMCVSFVVAGTR